MSGLYGLVLWDEPIQDYDCHLADYTRDDLTTVMEKWGSILTDALVEFINHSAQSRRGGKITRVYDLLSDSCYQSVIGWNRIASINLVGPRIYHRIFRAEAGPDALSKIATVLVQYLDRICDGTVPNLDDWGRLTTSTFDFSFESAVGKNTEAAREGLLLTERQVLSSNPWLTRLPAKVLGQWVLAEHAWGQIQASDDCDFGAVTVSFAKAVEGFFRGEMNNENASFRDILRRLSSSQFAHLHLTNDIGDLKEYRDRGAHSKSPPIRRSEMMAARDLALKILQRASNSF